ncbi:MAG TPA: hypothetical protein VKB50_11725 [Vicinamibacterales bacterium]|nr:hypothetical protein [Vicinamibacterales bacterium]
MNLARQRRGTWAVAVWLVSFGLTFTTVTLLNDHFDRITRARQILAYGDQPFRDFRDPGYYLTLYVSAAGQALSGGGLLGEVAITSAALATSSTLAFLLATSMSGSVVVGLGAVLLTWLVPARPYDWDKVLFYMSGLALCWRWIDRRSRALLAAFGALTVVAGLCRYDNGLYLFAMIIIAVILVNRRAPRTLVRDIAFLFAAILVTIAPALIAVQLTSGIGEAIRQITTYASIEGTRSLLFSLPELGFDRTSLTWLFIVGALLFAAVRATASYWGGTGGVAGVKILAGAALLLCIVVFVLRNPIEARVGAAIPVAGVLAAYLPAGRIAWRPPPAWAIATFAVIALAGAGIELGGRVLRIPGAAVRRLVRAGDAFGAQDPDSPLFPGGGALSGLAEYLNRCTRPDDRVLLTWYAPEVYFFAQRGFAGGMAVMFGRHWSSDADQRTTIALLEQQRAPFVVMSPGEGIDAPADFPLLATYIARSYQPGGESTFGDPRLGAGDRYRVLVRRGTHTTPDARWNVACLTDR